MAGPLLDVLRGVSLVAALQASALSSEDWASMPLLALMLVPAGAVTGLATSSMRLMLAAHPRVRGWAAWALPPLFAVGVMAALMVATAGPALTTSAAAAAGAVFLATGPRILRTARRPVAGL